MVAETMIFSKNCNIAEARIPYKTLRKSIVLTTTSFRSEIENAAARIPYKTYEISIVLTTDKGTYKRAMQRQYKCKAMQM